LRGSFVGPQGGPASAAPEDAPAPLDPLELVSPEAAPALAPLDPLEPVSPEAAPALAPLDPLELVSPEAAPALAPEDAPLDAPDAAPSPELLVPALAFPLDVLVPLDASPEEEPELLAPPIVPVAPSLQCTAAIARHTVIGEARFRVTIAL
jgi:remodeling and spacing factor 1